MTNLIAVGQPLDLADQGVDLVVSQVDEVDLVLLWGCLEVGLEPDLTSDQVALPDLVALEWEADLLLGFVAQQEDQADQVLQEENQVISLVKRKLYI